MVQGFVTGRADSFECQGFLFLVLPSSFLYSMPSMKTCPMDGGGLNGHKIYLEESVGESQDALALSSASSADGQAASPGSRWAAGMDLLALNHRYEN